MPLTGLEQVAGDGVVVLHHVSAVGFHGVAAGAFVEHGLDTAKGPLGETGVEAAVVDVVGNAQIGQVAEFVAIGQVIHRDDVLDAAGIQTLDDVAANEAGRAGDHDAHANNSW